MVAAVRLGVSYHGGGHEEVPWQQCSQAQDEEDDAHQTSSEEEEEEEECYMLQEAGWSNGRHPQPLHASHITAIRFGVQLLMTLGSMVTATSDCRSKNRTHLKS